MQSRRSFLSGGIAAPALLLGQKTASERPDVLFIAADDMNNSLGCFGHPLVKSPNIDRIAAMGVRFDRAYCQFPLCGPSRTSLLSGLRPDSTKIFATQIAIRDTVPDALTLPQHFKNSGWKSHRFGKMYHMDVPASVGTNKWDDPPSWDVAISPPGSEQKTKGEAYNLGRGWNVVSFPGEGKDQADDRAADLAIETFAKRGSQPVFVGLGLLRPHLPSVAPARFFDLYPKGTVKAVVNPPNDRDDIPKASEISINTRANDMGMNAAERDEAVRAYFATVSYMDWQVGRVLGSLEKSGRLRNTVIVFWGDHGWHLGEHHRWHKRSLFEESARAPLIVAAPGRKGNGKGSRALVEFVDMYPTIAELAGLPRPAHLEGQSMVPLLDNPARPWKTAAFTQMHGPDDIVGRSARTDRYRYTRWTGPYPDEELYDHESDPKEYTNLARKASSAALLQQMRGTLDRGWKAARAKV